MTHTEESLMALAYRTHSEGYGPLCKAIREVLAEKQQAALNSISAFAQADENFARAEKAEAELSFKAALVHELLPYQERALKAEAERDYWKADSAELERHKAHYKERAEKAEAECERLKQELVGQAFKFGLVEDELRKDAERYRWLRGGPDVPPESNRWARWEVRHWCGRWWNTMFAEALDAAIDAARAGGGND